MTPTEARSDVAKVNAAFLDAGLAIAVNPLVPFRTGDTMRLSWPQANGDGTRLTDHDYTSVNEYRLHFAQGHYTALLQDGGLIQASYDFSEAVLVGCRFCYYPCPILWPDDRDAGDWDDLNDLLQSSMFAQIEDLERQDPSDGARPNGDDSRLRLRSPIRFDYAPKAHGPTEPASHAHIGGAEARIPVHAPLSFGQFLHFVIKHYYPEYSALIEALPMRFLDRTITFAEECSLHFNWRRTIGDQ
jgi:hypothetical protein